MSIDPKRLIADLKNREPERATVSLFVNKKIYKEFKDFCEKAGVGTSELIEEFMREAIQPHDGASAESSPALRDIIALLSAMDEPQLNARLAALKAELDASNRPASAKRRKKAE